MRPATLTEAQPPHRYEQDTERDDGAPPPSLTRLGGFRLGSIAGIEVHIDWSLLLIFMLVVYALGGQVLASWHPTWSPALRWGVGVIAALGFFASVLAHEMSHALVGRWQGIRVRRITLFLFGGVAHMDNQPPSPQAELLMAAIGPVVSITIGIAATVLAISTANVDMAMQLSADPERALAMLSPVQSILLWLGPINVMLGIFNLVPGFPLDGGRVFRALAWWATGDILRATRWASLAGRGFAAMLMALGVAMAFGVRVPFFGSGIGSGLWLVLIGWFLHKAARASFEQLMVRTALRGVHVADIMRTRVDVVAPDMPVSTLMREHVMQSDLSAFPVVHGGNLVGVVSARDAMQCDSHAWETTPVSAIMRPAESVRSVPPMEEVGGALRVLQEQGLTMLPVVDDHRFVGSLHAPDVFKWIMVNMDEGALVAKEA